jgi:myo-inositol catabolism protein IolC
MMPFDHRASFEHGVFGWTGALSPEQTAQIAATKQIIHAAVLRTIAEGVPEQAAAVLVDEQFGREVLADARAGGLTTACPAENSGEAELQDCLAVAETAQQDGRSDVRGIVLGHHAEEVRVRRWLEVAATVPAFVGFAAGRTTFWQPLQDRLANRIGKADAVAAIARSYRDWVDTWDTARGQG